MGVDGNGPKRFSVQRNLAIVARLLHGEPLAREPIVAAHSGGRLTCGFADLGKLSAGFGQNVSGSCQRNPALVIGD